jgi:hypothetical protein
VTTLGTQLDLSRSNSCTIRGQRHLVHVLTAYSFGYFNPCRPHPGIRQRIPIPSETKQFTEGATVRSLPVLGGLHHDYQVAA